MMGYRSDVVLLIKLEEYEDMINYIPVFYNTIEFTSSNLPSLEDFTKEIKNI